VLGAKNLTPSKEISQTKSDVTFTVDSDGVVTLNGTSNNTIFRSTISNNNAENIKIHLTKGTYTYSLCDTEITGVSLVIKDMNGQDILRTTSIRGANFTLSEDKDVTIDWRVESGTTFSNTKFKAMIRLASDPDNTYVPYAKTNQQLTVENEALTNNINVNGSKNVLASLTPSGTYLGITISRNESGDIVVNGTATASPTTISLFDRTFKHIGEATILKFTDLGIDKTKKYVFSRAEKVSNFRYNIRVMNGTTQVAEIELGNNDGLYTVIDFSQYTCDGLKADIVVANGTTITNKVFSAMLCLESDYDLDPTYQPYAKTNQQLTAKTDGLWDNMMNNGAVNLLENVGTTTTVNGITFTVNSDGTVTANGTATANAVLKISDRFTLADYIGRKYVDAKKNEASSSTYSLIITYRNGSGAYVNETYVPTEGFILSTISNATLVEFGIFVKSGQSVSNLTFKPMITVASYNGDYVPYAKTNRELTDEFKSYGITTIWTGSKTKGDTGMNFDASPYDLCFAQVGGTWCRLITGVGGGSTTRKKFSALYAGRDYVNASTYEQYYLLDIVPDGTIATCGWFDIASKDTQNAKLAGQKALELALAGTSTWTNPTWKTLADVETNVNVSKIIGIKFQPKS
jgi:hypothetical protein